MALITSKITYYRSTSYSFEATVEPPEGLSVVTGLFTVKAEPDSNPTDGTALIKKDVSAVNNVCTFSIAPPDVPDTVDANVFNYSIHVILSDGKIYPFAAGKFDLKVDTTNRES